MSEFLGARISLISRSDIRYVGILHEINSDDSTVSLENVRSFGTEGRKGNPDDEVAPSDQVYEYIVFRGTDVKDLRIEEGPGAVKENKPPAVPNDPAIVGARPRPGKIAPSPPAQQGPLGGPGFGYFPQMGSGWGRGNVPGPNTFGGMPYPPPPHPQWFTQTQEFSPMAPGPWNNYAFPPGPGGPPGPLGQPNRQPFSPQPPNNQAQAQAPTQAPPSRPTPIGSAVEPKLPPPAQSVEPPSEPKHVAQQPPVQPVPPVTSASAPPPPVDSKPTAEEVKATTASLVTNASMPAAPEPSQSAPIPTGPSKQSGPSQIMPAVPLPAALTARAAQQAQASASKAASEVPNAAALRDATQAAKAAVAVAMAKLEAPHPGIQQAASSAMDNLTRKVNEMRMQPPRNGPNFRGGNSRGRGSGNRPARVEVPDSDYDFASANAKFNKHEIVKEAIAGSPLKETPNGTPATPEATSDPDADAGVEPAYNRSKSFFDNISSEARDRIENHGQKPGGREWRGEEQRRNMETFGQGSVDGGYRGYRGRGRGRGGRGRGGYSRGGRGGYRNRDAPPVVGE